MKSLPTFPSRSNVSTMTLAASLLFAGWALGAVSAGCDRSDRESGADAKAGAADIALCPHEVAERFCPICHPEVKNDPNILLCAEHGNIPEEICTACHPELKAKYRTCAHELPPAFCASCLEAKKKG
jgi:hypothetical protein